jgi:type I restriction enzyme S subunit
LLEGLEVEEVELSETFKNKDFRIDSDFWTKEPYRNPKLKYDKIGNVLIKAQYGISISMNEDNVGYPIYRMNEIHNMLTDLDVEKSADISKEEFIKFKLKDRDVLFNRTNSYEWVGRTGLYRKVEKQEYTFASYLVRFVPDENIVNPEYLTAFLNTKYGIRDIKRRSRQSINQTNVNPEEVKEILLPILNKSIQLEIKNCFDTAHESRLKSKQLYQQAETLLLETLGLTDFELSSDPINIKSFKESFLETGRLDAEYYQKKYDDYLELIQNYSSGFDQLASVCELKDKNYNPKDNIEYKYIELANIGTSGDITDCTVSRGVDLPSRARRLVKADDVIISSIEGSLSSCALVTEKYNKALCSTGFYVINSKQINSETLLVLFKSEPMQNILKQNCSGTILTAINKNEFQNIPIPLIKIEIQKQIKEKITESFRLKQQSEELLEAAKLAVEIAIEKGENEAITHLKNQLKVKS